MKTRDAILIGILAGAAVGAFGVWHFLGRHAAMPSHEAAVAGETKQLWTCGMHPQVLQDKPGMCPICGMKLTPVSSGNGGVAAKSGERRIAYYWDPMMSPPFISDKPGKSPMGMDLVPRYEDELSAGPSVSIDPVVVQNMGVRTAEAKEAPLRRTIRAVGYFREAQPLQNDVTLKIGGWVEKLFADTEGMFLPAGAPLFELYSPELLVAQEELVAAAKASPDLLEAAKQKLLLWNVALEDVEAIASEGKARRTIVFRNPAAGHLIEKRVVAGSSVQAGEKLLRIVDHSKLWLDAQVYERDLPYVALELDARATARALPGKEFTGKVIFIHPHVDEMTRAVDARIEFRNPDFALKPGMYANVEIPVEIAAKALQVPREAVIDTGTRQIAFVAKERGRFDPRLVKMGSEGEGGLVQILEGLAPGETVVTSGQFLLDVESRMREAIQKMLDAGLAEKMDHGDHR